MFPLSLPLAPNVGATGGTSHFRYVKGVLDFDCVPFSIVVGNIELESPLAFDC